MKKIMMAVGAAMIAGASVAATTTSFAYQGMLRDAYGEVLSGTTDVPISFKLYTSQSNGEAVWGRKVSVRLATNGLFNVELSDSAGTECSGLATPSSLDTVIEAAQSAGNYLYLGLTVENSAGEIRPRQKLVPSPMTSFAQNVAEAKGDFTVGKDVKVNGNLTLAGEGSKLEAPNAEIKNLTVGGNINLTGTVNVKPSGDGMTVDGALAVKSLKVNGVEPFVPVGCIVMWSGEANQIPEGWWLCDGSTYPSDKDPKMNKSSSPDLRGRFIVGRNENVVHDGKTYDKTSSFTEYSTTKNLTGGSESVKLEEVHTPPHRHPYLSSGYLYDYRTYNAGAKGGGTIVPATTYSDLFQGYHGGFKSTIMASGSNNHGYQTGSCGHYEVLNTGVGGPGSATPHETRPPWYALCFIIKYK